MKSRVSATLQIDDLAAAAGELLAGIGQEFPLGKSTIGLLFCYSDMDSAGLAGLLGEQAGFPVVGCTGIANMDQVGGFHDMAATLTVLTADDCTFAHRVSGQIHPGNVQAQVDAAYREICSDLNGAPGLLLAIPPYLLEVMLDEYSEAFNRIAPGVPVVGGLPSYNATGDENLVLTGDGGYPDRLVMVGIGGDVRPVFSVQNVTSKDLSRKRKVVRAENNVVYQVGEQTFTQYLKDVGLPVEQLAEGNNTITFVSNPLLLESRDSGYAFARTLHEIDLEKGTGTAIGRIPQGATLSICTLERGQIEQAALAGIRELTAKMEAQAAQGYAYSTVLAISCIGRHLLMTPRNEVEVSQILSDFPQGLTLSGFYSYGEIGPQGASQNQNFAHNESLVLCAF